MKNNKALNFLKVGTSIVAFFGLAMLASATTATWVPPSGPPPSSSVGAPVNTSASTQSKAGELDLNNFQNIGWTYLGGSTAIGGTWIAPPPPGRGRAPATAPALYIKQGTAHSSGALEISGQENLEGILGVVQNDGSVVPTTTTGYNSVYVQGIPVCLQNGSNCPTVTGGLSTVSHDATLTGGGTTASPLSVVSSGGLTTVAHDSTLTGNGSTGSPLGIAHTIATVYLYQIAQYPSDPAIVCTDLSPSSTSTGMIVNPYGTTTVTTGALTLYGWCYNPTHNYFWQNDPVGFVISPYW